MLSFKKEGLNPFGRIRKELREQVAFEDKPQGILWIGNEDQTLSKWLMRLWSSTHSLG